MGFKMKGPSMHSGTASHKSALKSIQSVEARKQAVAAAGQASTSGESSGSPAKVDLAYGGTKTWGQAQSEGEELGFDLNQTTRDQRAYEKEMKAKHGKDWNKREDNQWKKRQNTINTAVGSKVVYDVDSEVEKLQDEQVVTDKKIVDEGETKMAKKGPQQTNEEGEKVYGFADDVTKKLNKSEQTTSNKIARQKVRDARKEFGRGSDEVKAAKVNRKETRKKNKQMVKTDRKDRKFVRKDEKYDRKITRREGKGKDVTKLKEKKAANLQKEKEFGESLGTSPAQKRSPAKCPLLAAAVPALISGAAGAIGKKAASKKDPKKAAAWSKSSAGKAYKKRQSSPAKCPLIAAAVPALVKGIAGGIGKKAGEKVAK
jgi:hypothetical protein